MEFGRNNTAFDKAEFAARLARTHARLAAKRIGVEADSYYFTAKSLEVLRRELPNARFEDAGVLVNWVRAVKSPAEIALMIQAARIAEITMHKAIEMIGVGVRQCDLAA